MTQGTINQKILIIDFGSQVTQLIARRVREAGVYSEIHPYNKTTMDTIKEFNPKGIILSGGPSSVYEEDSPKVPDGIFNLGLPILGICYGQQTMCQQLGGEVLAGADGHGEFGRADISIKQDCPLFKGVWEKDDSPVVWMSHGDKVTRIPEGFEVMASSNGAPFAITACVEKNFYGIQFHPEVVHTPDGAKLIESFVKNVCKCTGDWTMQAFKQQAIEKVRAQVGDKRVICGLSGGVDSSVVAVLLHEAIGDQLTCIFVDHGLLRLGEAEQVQEMFTKHYKMNLITVNAEDTFLGALEGIDDPEKKRKIIGGLFIDTFDAEAKKIGGADFLAQGTLYPDVIESVSFTSSDVVIKSHHNVGGLPEAMKMDLVEPLRELFKDEVRILGKELGLPAVFIERHPFPGPGLAIRIPGAVTKEKCDILRKADAVYLEEIRNAGLYNEIWQAFAVLLPVKTVGVMGDKRTYEYVCGIRAVTSTDGMTADVYPFDGIFLTGVATRMINEVQGINRVVYDFTSKPPGTIEWE